LGYGAVLNSGFDLMLHITECSVLDLTDAGDIAKSEALKQNCKARNGLLLVFETSKMMNKVIEEQAEDTEWTGVKFTKIWARLKVDKKPGVR
jgi:hypothetical protein